MVFAGVPYCQQVAGPSEPVRANNRPSLRAQRSNPFFLCAAKMDCFVARAPRNDGWEGPTVPCSRQQNLSTLPRTIPEGTRLSAKPNPLAGKIAEPSMLANIPRLVTAYFAGKPDPAVPAQRVAFGTSGHRGSAFNDAFNENHILAISQAVCDHRKAAGIDGPLFVGIDTHALAEPALASALEVFSANGVEVMIDAHDGYTPTPVISHAILTANKGRGRGLADGVVITPSHNPPEDGGFKYNPPNGGPADTDITAGIERAANGFLEDGLRGIKRMPYDRARKSACVHRYDYIEPYVADLAN